MKTDLKQAKGMRGLLVLLFSLPVLAEVQITYLANEGVMLAAGGTKVLVDAVFRDSLGDYVRHDSVTQENLETGKTPYDGVSLALATHFHLDHWDAGAISRFLRLNPKSLFASTPTATAMIPRSLRPQVQELWPGGQHGVSLSAAGVTVDAFPLGHGTTQNLGYRIGMGERVMVHVGDADAAEANFKTLLEKGAPDVAMIPFWWLLDKNGVAFVRNQWKPRRVVAFHFGAADAAQSAGALQKSFGDAWMCIRPGESRVF
jgi:L-ascorbate metabolism protein UlaG (beta-lactamase superfamily)